MEVESANIKKSMSWSQVVTNGDVVEGLRLENAMARLSHMEKQGSQTGLSAIVSEDLDDDVLTGKLQDAIGQSVDFTSLKFRALNEGYDDLPTFPVRPNFAHFHNSLKPASACVVFDGCPEDPYHPSNTPIYQTATFVQPSCAQFGAYDYTRSGNPTRTALEKHAAMLEKAAAAFAFASGMAALHTVMRLLKCGDEIVCNEDIYGGMYRLLTQDCANSGIIVRFTDTTDLAAVEKVITAKTKIIHTESPSNPRMRISDLRGLAKLAHRCASQTTSGGCELRDTSRVSCNLVFCSVDFFLSPFPSFDSLPFSFPRFV